MQRFKYFLASSIAVFFLMSCAVFAQDEMKDSPIVVVSAVAPVYPAVALAFNLEGDFQVDLEIDQNGKVISSKAVAGTHKFMRKLIEETANRWQFAPDKSGEKMRRVQLTFTFRYTPNESSINSTPIFYPPYKIEV